MTSDSDTRLQETVAHYFDRLNGGEEIDPVEILAEHPEMGERIVEELYAFVGLGDPSKKEAEPLGDPVEARPEDRWDRAARWARRNGARVASYGLVAVVTVTALFPYPSISTAAGRASGGSTPRRSHRSGSRRIHTGSGPMTIPNAGSGVASSQTSPQTWLGAAWKKSTDPVFSNGLLRVKVRAVAEGPTLEVVLRRKGNGAGYGFFASNTRFWKPEKGGWFEIQRHDDVSSTLLGMVNDASFRPGEDWILEAGAVGDRISLAVWRTGEPTSSAKRVEFIDKTHRYGQVILRTYISSRREGDTLNSAAFDDVSFTPVLLSAREG